MQDIFLIIVNLAMQQGADILKTLNPDHIKEVIELVNRSPYFRLLAMKVRTIGIGFSKIEMNIANKHLNTFGGIHGGVYSSLIDSAAYWAVYADIEESAGLISLDVKVDNLAPVKEGRLSVEGKRIKAGKSICIAEAAVIDSAGKCLAFGTSKQMVLPRMQTMEHALAAMGHAPLPPKFIPLKTN